MPGWNFAEIWEVCATKLPDAVALRHGEREITWSAFNRRADGIARTLLDAGAGEQDKVAQYLYNCPEYLESMFGVFKAGLVPVNTNYRYAEEELVYLWDNADAVAVVFHGTFTERIEAIRHRVPKVRTWLWVDDGDGACPEWATPYEDAAGAGTGERVVAPWGRDGHQILMMYTGGTTGMPKGVMWRQDDLIHAVLPTTNAVFAEPTPDYAKLAESIQGPGLQMIPACPLMHGTGQFTAFIALSNAGSVTTLTNRHLDVVEILDTIQAKKIQGLTIVGDAFAKPILAELDANPGRWDLSSLFLITSSGVMWSEPVKQGLLKHNPTMMLIDAFSSSEAIGLGQSVSTAGNESKTAKFVLGENARVITDDGRDVEPGSGEIGRVAVRGYTPIGYYKDPEKSAATFVTIDGETYSMPGDYAQVEADGTLTLLGRGSVCINTGGEKVFPEEVEEILKRHPSVLDAVAVGLPDDKFGETVNAVVQLREGASLDQEELIGWVKQHLASFKAPKRVVAIDTVGRAPNGKVDYKRLKRYAAEQLGVSID
ncbi:acyl-CoA synthetase [Rhabdothermincola sediminis]|uniref:acyl-CoA synthetase n=1 Tax=Rhabdothermincola sediminis TaxID=2751370 RepID=UPI001AA0156D|nr:acyl-CoA synthetase [Rhabdothermincola sediminis]